MNKPVIAKHEVSRGGIASYSIGFALSLIITLAAYVSASKHLASGWALVFILSALAIIQLLVQLVFFLHLAHEERPRWNLQALLFAAGVVIIIVFGSLWIMKNLSYAHHQVTPNQIIKDEGYQQ
jgi:cytochrome o ubiquinol oxidase operon protein cyoD